MTLRVRVALLVAAVVTVAVVGVGGTALGAARSELTEEVDDDLLKRASFALSDPRSDFWELELPPVLGLGRLLRQDPLGAFVGLDAYARVIFADLDDVIGRGRDGRVLVTLGDDMGDTPDLNRLDRVRRKGLTRQTVRMNGDRMRLLTVFAGDGVFVQIARPFEEVERALDDLRSSVVLFGSLAVAIASVGAWFLAGRAVRPIVRLTETVEQIAETGDVNRDVEDPGGGEVGRLARSFRTMLSALAQSRQQQRRLVMDASHELRTPLTSLRTNAEMLDRFEELPAEDRAAIIADVRAELGELTDLVSELVDLAADVRADESLQIVELEDVLASAVQRAARRWGIDVSLRVKRSIPLEGRPEALTRAVRNLIDNAAKFGGSGPVEVVLDGGSVTVHDSGPGVDEAERQRIFERFYRLEADRDRPGSGLGLAIVRQVAQAHGGTVSVGASPLGGAAFTLRIPEIDD